MLRFWRGFALAVATVATVGAGAEVAFCALAGLWVLAALCGYLVLLGVVSAALVILSPASVSWWVVASPPAQGEDHCPPMRNSTALWLMGMGTGMCAMCGTRALPCDVTVGGPGADLMGMTELERAYQDLAAARAYPASVRARWMAEYRRVLNVAVVLAVVAILVSLVVVL